MRPLIPALLLAWMPIPGATVNFTVDDLSDDAAAHDASPGDGECETPGATCTLRAAIQEANALGGDDIIEFSATGTILVGHDDTDPPGPLPALSDMTTIAGPLIDPDGTIPDDNPPAIILDGSHLVGSGNNHGLRLLSGADNSGVFGLAIINFPDDGIRIDAAEGLNIGRNHIGIAPDGTPAGNGGHGISGLTDDGFFGKLRVPPFGELDGYGNLVSANGAGGVSLIGSNNRFAGNFIGTGPAGIEAEANGGTGLSLSGSGNFVGLDEHAQAANVISGNAGEGLLIGGTNAVVAGNHIGIDHAGGPLGNADSGIRVIGDNHTIGTPAAHGANLVAGNGGSGVAGGIGGSLTNSVIQDNRLGMTAMSLGNSGSGVFLSDASSVTIRNNLAVNNDFSGIHLREGTTGTVVVGNRVGFGTDSTGAHPHPNDTGIRVDGTGNTIGADPAMDPNVIGYNENFGIVLHGSDNTVVGNLVGVTEDGEAIGNGASGISLQHTADDNRVGSDSAPNVVGFNHNGISIYSATNMIEGNFVGTDESCADMGNDFLAISINDQATNNTVVSNTVAFSDNDGVIVDDPATFNSIYRNTMHANAGLPIDLDPSGPTPNDSGDFDLGANYLMNFPEITVLGYDMSTETLMIELLVDSATENAIYPLRIDFYWHDRDEPNQGQRYIGNVTYDMPQSPVTYELVLPEGTTGGTLRATATENDGAGNTSEMSPERMFGFFDPIFDDDFEEGDCPT